MTTTGALSDLLVLDLSRVLAGLHAAMVLGDYGARVIKIEQPGRGDDTRQWGPPFTASGESAYYLGTNRNKESITLDLHTAQGQQILRDLTQRADVLVENFKVGTLDRLGLGYEALRTINPGLIYCAITGYGQDGPYCDRPGYDTVIQAQSGLMSITGPVDGPPSKVGVAITDLLAGMYALSAILAALHHRTRTGDGQFVDIALLDAQLGSLANVASAYLVSKEPPARHGNAHGTIVPYQAFATADGTLMLAVGNDRQFASLCRVLDRADWATDPRFATNPARVQHRAVLVPLLEEILVTAPTATWETQLLAAGVPCGPVNNIPGALADAQAQARGMVQTVDHVDGPLSLVGPVPKLSATPATLRSAPPRLGEHTDVVLGELLGYSAAQCAQLRADGVV